MVGSGSVPLAISLPTSLPISIPRTFGFRKLSDLIRETDAFEIDDPEGGAMRIREKPSPAARPRGNRKAIPF